MSKRLKRKSIAMILVELLFVAILGVVLYQMQVKISANDQAVELQKKMEPLRDTVAEAKKEAEEHTGSYDSMYQAKAASLAYMIQKKVDSKQTTDTLLQKYKDLLHVTNALVLDKEGTVVAKAEKSDADFTYARYNQLRTVFSTHETSEPFEVEREGKTYRYYGAVIDENTMAVIEQDPAELKALLSDTVTWKSMLRNVSVGSTGYAFALSAKDYTFLYHPEDDLVGQDALDAGIQVEALEDGNRTWMEIYGERYLCGVANLDDAYVICALPAQEIRDSCNITVLVVLCVFFAVITLVVTYAIFILKDQEGQADASGNIYARLGKFYFNRAVSAKLGAMIAAGLICVFVSSLYMQELFSLSGKSISNSQNIEGLQATISKYEENVKMLEEQYDTRYLNKCRTAAHILTQKPEFRNRDELARISNVLDVEFISFFDATGTIIATNSYYNNFRLSQNKEDQSYEFNKLLAGGEYLIQEAQMDDALGEYNQYIGVAIRNDEGMTEGFVQICVNPEKLEHALEKLQIASVLDGVQIGARGFAFAINKDEHTFAYYPDERFIGRNVAEYGIRENQIHGGFSDYLTIGSGRYFANCLETDQYYVYACVPKNEIASNKVAIALFSTAVSFICLLIIAALLCINRGTESAEPSREKQPGSMINVTMPDGKKKKTMDVSSRWSNVALHWAEKTPEQKMTSVLKGLLAVYALLICFAYIFQMQSSGNTSMFAYIINGGWERGLNVFAVTGCIFVICIVITLTICIQEILRVLSNISSAQGETVFRLISSFVKYASVVALLYYCFALLGVDTGTLLASAGLLGLMISLGAQKLVSDILAGLFIIFEGEFRVGDIVTIGDWRGTVVEIGIRTTKIEEAGGNIKVINNSAISGVINMTRQYSFAACDFGIEYGESLERVEYILKEELPRMRERLPAIMNGPFYKGVSALGDNSVNIKIVAQCAEGDRIQLMRDLNREVKLLFDKYEINIPFPQVVLNQPAEFKKATEWQKMQAEKFTEEQKELAKKLEDEQ